jgi:hypothetical protein
MNAANEFSERLNNRRKTATGDPAAGTNTNLVTQYARRFVSVRFRVREIRSALAI